MESDITNGNVCNLTDCGQGHSGRRLDKILNVAIGAERADDIRPYIADRIF